MLLLLLAYINYIYARDYSGLKGDPAIAVLAFIVSVVCGNAIVLSVLGALGGMSLFRTVYCWIKKIKRPLLLNICSVVLIVALVSWAVVYVAKGISSSVKLKKDSSTSLVVYANGDRTVFVKNTDSYEYVLSPGKDSIFYMIDGSSRDTLVIDNDEQICFWLSKPYITFPILVDNRDR